LGGKPEPEPARTSLNISSLKTGTYSLSQCPAGSQPAMGMRAAGSAVYRQPLGQMCKNPTSGRLICHPINYRNFGGAAGVHSVCKSPWPFCRKYRYQPKDGSTPQHTLLDRLPDYVPILLVEIHFWQWGGSCGEKGFPDYNSSAGLWIKGEAKLILVGSGPDDERHRFLDRKVPAWQIVPQDKKGHIHTARRAVCPISCLYPVVYCRRVEQTL